VLDEQQLLAQIAAGNEEALHHLYLTYRPRLRRYLWHQLDGDSTGVDEALQDVFLAVWRTASSYRAEARVSTWLYQIAHYVALGARRRLLRYRGSQPPASSDNEDDALAQSGAVYADCDDIVLDRMALHEALNHLSPKHREVLALVFQHGFSLNDAALILDVPAGTVKSRISYARKALWHELYAAPVKELPHDA
jgi:RNA polymerase sigma-70 factor (ECF subfamily)